MVVDVVIAVVVDDIWNVTDNAYDDYGEVLE
jgi:hypothetical protein